MAEAQAGRRVLMVTGGGRGIGAAVARMAAARGYDLCLTYRGDAGRAATTADACRDAGARVLLMKSDVADPQQVRDSFAALDHGFGRLDALVNNAGVTGKASSLLDSSDETWRDVLATNVIGLAACCREAVRRMATSRGGHGGAIVNVSSRASELGGPGEWIHYAASKGAVDTLTIGLAREVAAEGIRVNAVNPGLIDTEIHAAGGFPDRVARLGHQVPMGRGGSAEEVAEAILFLLSPAASYVSAAKIHVGGAR